MSAEATITHRVLERMVRSCTEPQAQQLCEASGRAVAQQAIAGLRRMQTPHINKMEADLRAAFNELAVRVERAALPLLDTGVYMERKWRTDLTPAQVETLINNILTASRLRDWAEKRLTPAFWRHYEDVQNTTARVLIRAGLVTNLTQTTINRILDHGGRRAGLVDIVGDTRKALFRVITQGVDAGMSPRETAKLIRDFIPEGRFRNAGAKYRASLIARTETLHAQRMASLERYAANNVKTVMAYDGDSDPECMLRNGQEYTLRDAHDEMMNTHPQCVLSFGPVVSF